jgi:hypothetical protein
MRLPKQAEPVIRVGRVPSAGAGDRQVVAADPANCAGIPNNIVGTCMFPDGPGGKFNCVACCAQRQALSWQGGGHAVVC